MLSARDIVGKGIMFPGCQILLPVWELSGVGGFDPLVPVFTPLFCHLRWPWGQWTP